MKQHRSIQRLVYLMIFLLITMTVIVQPIAAQADLDLNAESAIIVDVDTGKILYEKDSDVALPPASMTKMMTEYLVWEAVEDGEIDWDQKTKISDYPYELSANPNFSGIGLKQDKEYSVRELYEAMAINSDNGTSIALAELIADSEGEFVELMNEKAEEMGLPDYKFVNSTGLENDHLGDNYPEGTDPNGTNLLSAKSAALLGYHLVEDFPDMLDISSTPQTDFDDETITNWNWMLPHEGDNFNQFYYEGVDGLKTGETDLAGFTFTATAERDGKRLITVVMKTDSYEERFGETAKLLDYGFENFDLQELYSAGDQLEDESIIPVSKGKAETVEISMADGFELPIKEGDEEDYDIEYHIDEDLLNDDGELTAPIEADQKVGQAELIYTGNDDFDYIISNDDDVYVDLVTTESVEKGNWFVITMGSIGEFFSNLFSTVVDAIKGLF